MKSFDQLARISFIAQRKIFALHDFTAEEQVDEEEIPPHKQAPAVDMKIQAAFEDRRQTVKPSPGFQATLFHLISRHPLRRERNHPVTIIRVQPPAVVKQPPFAPQPFVKRSAGEGRQMIEGDDVKLVADGEIQCLAQRVAVVVVVAEDECDVEPDAVSPQVMKRLLVAALHRVEGFMHPAQIFRVERFKPDQQSLTAAGLDESEKLSVRRGVDAGLADPSDFQRDQRAEKFLRLLHIRRYVVVNEKYQRLVNLLDLFDDFGGRATRLCAVEVGLDGAELAFEMAAASGLDQADRQIALTREDRTVELQPFERRAPRLFVDALQTALAKILDYLWPQTFGFADDD